MAAGELEIREVAPAGFTPTYPTGGVHPITLGAGEQRRDIDFGNHEAQGTASGTKWLDASGALGVRDSSDVGVAGVMVFVDGNDNGRMDAGEPRAISESDNSNTAAIDETGRGRHFDRSILKRVPAGSRKPKQFKSGVMNIL